MKHGWRLVAKLGKPPGWYPHLLSDPCGWGLRLGPNFRADMKYYSSLPSLLAGLVEHLARRRLGADHPILSQVDLVGEVRKELAQARLLCETATRQVKLIDRRSQLEAI